MTQMTAEPWKLDSLASAVDIDAGQAMVTHRVAGPGTRFVAGVVDLVVRLPLLLATWYAIFRVQEGLHWNQQLVLGLLVWLCIEFLYFFLFELITGGQTPGKNACACRVVGSTGKPATTSQLFIRNFARFIDFLPVGYLLGGIACWTSRVRRQRIGDRFASTLVVLEDSLREILRQSSVPDSVYSTSDDAYLLESVLMRGHNFREEVYQPLVNQLARYFYRKYEPEDELARLFTAGEYEKFLRELYRAEKDASTDE